MRSTARWRAWASRNSAGGSRGRITFWGEIDRQDPARLRDARARWKRAVREVRAHLYADGGVIAQCEFGPGAIPENVLQRIRDRGSRWIESVLRRTEWSNDIRYPDF